MGSALVLACKVEEHDHPDEDCRDTGSGKDNTDAKPDGMEKAEAAGYQDCTHQDPDNRPHHCFCQKVTPICVMVLADQAY